MIHRAFLLVAISVLFACAGPSQPAARSDALPKTFAKHPASGTNASISFPIPANAKTSTVGYVSPYTAQIIVTANGQSVLTAPVPFGTKSFTRSFGVPSGSVKFLIQLIDQSNRLLSQQTLEQNISSGSTTKLPLALQGLVARVSLVAASPAPPVGHDANIAVQTYAFDADNSFIGGGTYSQVIKLAFKDAGGHMKLLSNRVTAANQNTIVQYDGHLMTAADTVSTVGFAYNASLNLIGNAYTIFKTSESVVALATGPNHTMLFAQCNGGCS